MTQLSFCDVDFCLVEADRRKQQRHAQQATAVLDLAWDLACGFALAVLFRSSFVHGEGCPRINLGSEWHANGHEEVDEAAFSQGCQARG